METRQYDGLIINQKVYDKCDHANINHLLQRTIGYFQDGDYERLGIEPKNAAADILGIKANYEVRFLGTSYELDGKNYFYMLDVLPQHQYDGNSFMAIRPRDMDNLKDSPVLRDNVRRQTPIFDMEIKIKKPCLTVKPFISFIDNKFLQFDPKQTEACYLGNRFIGLGAPNSGKSCIAIDLFKNYLLELKKDGLRKKGPICLITQSRELLECTRNIINNSNMPDNETINLWNCEDILKRYYPSISFIQKEAVNTWIKENVNLKNYQLTAAPEDKNLFTQQLLNPKIIYEEFRVMAGYTEEEYLKGIGERQSTFGGNEDPDNKKRRKYLWEKFQSYMDGLKAAKKGHAEFMGLPDDSEWPEDLKIILEYVVCDEFQDLPPALIKSILKYSLLNCAFLGDEHQNIFWSRSIINYIKTQAALLANDNNAIRIINLPYTHQVSRAVLRATNRTLDLKIGLTEGLNSGYQYAEIEGLPDTEQEEGEEAWIVTKEDKRLKHEERYLNLFHQEKIVKKREEIAENPQHFVVIAPDQSYLPMAKKLFSEKVMVLDISQAKGQHFRHVIFLGPLDKIEHQQGFKLANTRLANNDVKASKNLAARHAVTSEELSHLLTGESRALFSILVIQEERDNANNKIIDRLNPDRIKLIEEEKARIASRTEQVQSKVASVPSIEIANGTEQIITKTEKSKKEDKDKYEDLVKWLKFLIKTDLKTGSNQAQGYYNENIQEYHPDVDFENFKAQLPVENMPTDLPLDNDDYQKRLFDFNLNANAPSKNDKIVIIETKTEKKERTNNRNNQRGRGRNGNRLPVNNNKKNSQADKKSNNKPSNNSKPIIAEDSYKALEAALIKDDFKKIQSLVNSGIDINKNSMQCGNSVTKKHYFSNPLDCSIVHNKYNHFINLLGLENINVNQVSGDGIRVIHRAIAYGKIEYVRKLLARSDIDLSAFKHEEIVDPVTPAYFCAANKNKNPDIFILIYSDKRILPSDDELKCIAYSIKEFKLNKKQILTLLSIAIEKNHGDVINSIFEKWESTLNADDLYTLICQSTSSQDETCIALFDNIKPKQLFKLETYKNTAKNEKNDAVIQLIDKYINYTKGCFVKAIQENNILEVQELIKNGRIDPNQKISIAMENEQVEKDTSCLSYAIMTKKLEIVKELIRAGSDCNFITKGKNSAFTPISYAISAGPDYVEALLGKGSNININVRSYNGTNTISHPLQEAIDKVIISGDQNLKSVELLLKRPDVDVNCLSLDKNDRINPLQSAINNHHLSIVNLLIQHKNIDLNKMGGNNLYLSSPLHTAAYFGDMKCIELLLSKGETPDKKLDINLSQSSLSGDTALHLAARGNKLEVVNRLLKSPYIDVNKKNHFHRTPLDIAETLGHTEIAKAIRSKASLVTPATPSLVSQIENKRIKASIVKTDAPITNTHNYVLGLLNEVIGGGEKHALSLANLLLHNNCSSLLFGDTLNVSYDGNKFKGNLFSLILNIAPAQDNFIKFLFDLVDIKKHTKATAKNIIDKERFVLRLLKMAETGSSEIQELWIKNILPKFEVMDLLLLSHELQFANRLDLVEKIVFQDDRMKDPDSFTRICEAMTINLDNIALLLLLKVKLDDKKIFTLLHQSISLVKEEIFDALLLIAKNINNSFTIDFASLYQKATEIGHINISEKLKPYLPAESLMQTPSIEIPNGIEQAQTKVTDIQKETQDKTNNKPIISEKDYQALHIAVLKNNIKAINDLINKGLDINENALSFGTEEENQFSSNLLDCSILDRNSKLFDGLLKIKSININQASGDGTTPLQRAINFNNIEMVKKLLERDEIDLAACQCGASTPRTPAYYAACNKNKDAEIFTLVYKHPKIILSEEEQDDIATKIQTYSLTKIKTLALISIAIEKNHTAIVSALLAKVADNLSEDDLYNLLSKNIKNQNEAYQLIITYKDSYRLFSLEKVKAKAQKNKNAELVKLIDKALVAPEAKYLSAINKNDFATLQELIRTKQIDVNKPIKVNPEAGEFFSSYLCMAILQNNFPLVKELLKAGANPNYITITQNDKRPLLSHAIEAGPKYVEALLAAENIDVNAQSYYAGDTYIKSFLYEAVDKVKNFGESYVESVKLLLANPKTNVNHISINKDEKLTPLHLATYHNSYAMVDLLLQRKDIDLNITTHGFHTGCSAFHLAVGRDHIDLIHLFLSKGDYLEKKLDINQHQNNIIGDTALHTAVKMGNLTIVGLLLKTPSIDASKANSFTVTPIQIAERDGRDDIALAISNKIQQSSLLAQPIIKAENKGLPVEKAKFVDTQDSANKPKNYALGLLNGVIGGGEKHGMILANLLLHKDCPSFLFKETINVIHDGEKFEGCLFSLLVNISKSKDNFIKFLFSKIDPQLHTKRTAENIIDGELFILRLLRMKKEEFNNEEQFDYINKLFAGILEKTIPTLKTEDLLVLSNELCRTQRYYFLTTIILKDERMNDDFVFHRIHDALNLNLTDIALLLLPKVRADGKYIEVLAMQAIGFNNVVFFNALLPMLETVHRFTINFTTLYQKAIEMGRKDMAAALKPRLPVQNHQYYQPAQATPQSINQIKKDNAPQTKSL